VEDALRRALAGTAPPPNLAEAALARLPPLVVARLFDRPLVPAAVLVGLQPMAGGGLQVILTRRNEQLRDHPGQISFPGGRLEPGDPDPIATALREAREEVGLLPGAIEVLGCLEAQAVVTGFAVCPVVALVSEAVDLRPEPLEVAEIFTVPLSHLAREGALEVTEREVRGVLLNSVAYRYGGHHIWGATAHMLAALVERIRP
jgi:8-oxo-dGTP pyrophosphatase MutT (NUDIX family)